MNKNIDRTKIKCKMLFGRKTPSGVSEVRAGVSRVGEERWLSFEARFRVNGDAGVNIDFAESCGWERV